MKIVNKSYTYAEYMRERRLKGDGEAFVKRKGHGYYVEIVTKNLVIEKPMVIGRVK